MAIGVLYHKRNFGNTKTNSLRSIFVDESLNRVLVREETRLDRLFEDIKEFAIRFNAKIVELDISNEIKTKSDFFRAAYLQEPDYNFHQNALRIKDLAESLIPRFVADVREIFKKIELQKSDERLNITVHVSKIKRLESLANEIVQDGLRLPKPHIIKRGTMGELEKIQEFGMSIRNASDKINKIKEVLHGIIESEEDTSNSHHKTPRLEFLSLNQTDRSRKIIFLKESKLEDDIRIILNEVENLRRDYERAYASYSQAASNADYEIFFKLLEKAKWAKRVIINLLQLYLDDILNSSRTECTLEVWEIEMLSKVKEYCIHITALPSLINDILGLDRHIKGLREVLVDVNLYSRESMKGDAVNDAEIDKLYRELKEIDFMAFEEDALERKFTASGNQQEVDGVMHITPREIVIPGTDGIAISGDLYLKAADYRPKIGIIALPGIADSKRVYYSMAVRAASMGFLVYCADLPSQGYSTAGSHKFGSSTESILLVIRYLKERYNLEKIGLVGWSLGSMVSMFALMRFTKDVESAMEKIDRILINFSEKKIRYDKLLEEVAVVDFDKELEAYSKNLQNLLRNLESKRGLLYSAFDESAPLRIYISRCEMLFKRELEASSRLSEYFGNLKHGEIKKIRKATTGEVIARLIASLNHAKDFMDGAKVPEYLVSLEMRDVERSATVSATGKAAILKANYRDIHNLSSSCYNSVGMIVETKRRLTAIIEKSIKKLKLVQNGPSELNALKEDYIKDLISLITAEYEKYADCKINALMLLSPVDYPQVGFGLKRIRDILGNRFPYFVDVLLFIIYREIFRDLFEKGPEKDVVPGSRFHVRKDTKVKAVKDSYEEDSAYRKLMKRLNLIVGEDPVQLRALKILKKENLRYALLAPSPIVYFNTLKEMCPKIAAEAGSVPKTAIFGEEDALIGMPKRGSEVINVFEGIGNIRMNVLKKLGHDLDFNRSAHDLYMDPVITKRYYDFFLMLSQQ